MSTKREKSNIRIIGDVKKPKVMLIHGIGFYWEKCFTSIIDDLKEKYCILVPELEGHSQDSHDVMVSVNSSANKIIQELSSNEINEVNLIYGVSLGASIAVEIALQNKIKVEHLILDGGQYESMGEMTEKFADVMSKEFKKIIKGEHMIPPVKEQMGYSSNNDVEVLQPLMYTDISIEALNGAFTAAYSYDIRECNEKLNENIVVMLGEKEVYAKKSILLLKEKSLKPIRVLEYPNKGHAEVLSTEATIISQEINKILGT